MTPEELEAAIAALADRMNLAETAIGSVAAAGDLIAGRMDSAEASIAAQANQITLIDNSTPTLEEQWFTHVISSWNGGTTFTSGPRMTLGVAPVPCRILSVDLEFPYTTLASGQPVVVASNTNYWRLTLERGLPSQSFPDIASKRTTLSGVEMGGPILTRTAWSFDSADWNANRDLAKGDLLTLLFAATGTPTPIRLPMSATVRYAAL